MHSLPGNAGNALTIQQESSSSLRSIVETSFRYRGLWSVVVVTVIAMALLYTLLTPREYRSEMDILVQNKRGDEQITPNRSTGSVTVNEVTEEQINSEIQMLESRSLADVVVDPQWNNHDFSRMTQSQLKAHEKAVEQFKKHLSVELVRKSNVIHTTYSASNPKVATDTLNRLLSAFLLKQREIAQPPGTSRFFADQAARYKSELDQAQQELAEYQQQHQIVTLADTEQNIDREINEAEADLRATDAQTAELSQRIGTQTAQLHGIPTRQMTQERTLPNDYSVERLNTMLAELENKRTSLLTKFTTEDRLVQEVDRQIADTKEALTKAQHMTSQERSTDVNPVWQSVTGSIIQDQTARQALKAKHDALTGQIATLRSGLSNAESSTVPYTTLRQKVSDLQNNYQLYTQKRDEAQIADAMNQNRLLNVAVEQSPTFSVTPFRPKPLIDLALGGFTAIFLACFMVFFAEMGRGTIATSEEIEKLSRFPVLATVPVNRLRSGRRAERLSDSTPVFFGLPGQSSGGARNATAPPTTAPLMRYRKESCAS
jgi:uncharacterized protein involved in exopolysaccharide biosynthesis